MNMVGELVLVRNRLVRLGLNSGDEAMSKAVSNLDVVTADLQTAVMKTRMQPIKKVFGRFPRLVRDLARQLKKEINLELVGEETDLDKNLVEALADPLVHLVRNAVDHGIECRKNAKPRARPVAARWCWRRNRKATTSCCRSPMTARAWTRTSCAPSR
jgi:two-component system chemotaxis sensor kinase CheA